MCLKNKSSIFELFWLQMHKNLQGRKNLGKLQNFIKTASPVAVYCVSVETQWTCYSANLWNLSYGNLELCKRLIINTLYLNIRQFEKHIDHIQLLQKNIRAVIV